MVTMCSCGEGWVCLSVLLSTCGGWSSLTVRDRIRFSGFCRKAFPCQAVLPVLKTHFRHIILMIVRKEVTSG